MVSLTAVNDAEKIFRKSTSYDNFVNAIRSSATKRVYVDSLKRYMKYLQITNVDDLLLHHGIEADKKLIESQVIKYVMSLRQDGLSYATMKYLVAPIFTFYQLNDVVLNHKKINRYFGEYKKVVRDTAYTTEQIGQALQNADQRMRCIILLLASTGCRIGAIPSLTLGNLTKIPEYGLYKITFYEGTNNEYYTFCTREAAQIGIDNYLEYRKRCS